MNNMRRNTFSIDLMGVVGHSGEALLGQVVPELVSAYAKTKKLLARRLVFLLLSGVCAVVGLVLLITTGTSTPREGWEHFWEVFDDGPEDFSPNLSFLPMVIVGVVLAIVFLAGISRLAVKSNKLKTLATLTNEIKGHDKVSIEDLSISKTNLHVGNSGIVLIVKKLIETGNLAGYEVIGSVGIAKVSLHATDIDFLPPSEAVNAMVNNVRKRASKCPGCGAPLNKSTGSFCVYCGSRLN